MNSEASRLSDEQIKHIRAKALRALGPIRPAQSESPAEPDILFRAERTKAGRLLPPYYVVYFLLVELLGFKNLGRWEKLAWSVPIEYKEKVFLVEHRKLGLGIFCVDAAANEERANEIRIKIEKACKAARPYFQQLAKNAIEGGKLNVHNNHASLYGRLQYMLGRYRAALKAEERAKKRPPVVRHYPNGGMSSSWRHWTDASNRVAWLAQGAIEAFFSWSEHALIHLAVLSGRIESGTALLKVTMGDWKEKYQLALDISDPLWKEHYDKLLQVRNEHRNFIAHGAFGKDGRAFSFHSKAGAVTLSLAEDETGQPTFLPRKTISDRDAVGVIEGWITDVRRLKEPHWMHLESYLTSILPFGKREYSIAISSVEEMERYIECQVRINDDHANMDW
ncbi:hypothetical protein [Stenotrophomonas sp. ATCM1_4]|uniref:hypothetical protein n=1 Tax=Stenotrophomonas sp. ATCM1_4 TaxID=2259330 RepID=UPI001050600D|nr:hypothetical protein [Stenotrophomonas sp. ATCM1_4]